MVYLIDTQILIWSLISPKKLSAASRKILESNSIWVSQVSLYEIAIKQKIGKLPQFDLAVEALLEQMKTDGFQLLSIQTSHLAAYDDIPLHPEHRDPFDRLILATALSENIPVISADKNFRLYVPQIQLIGN